MRVKKINQKMTMLTLVVALGAAVYLNWAYAKNAEISLEAEPTGAGIVTDGLAVETQAGAGEESDASETSQAGDKTYGEAQLVSVGSESSTDFLGLPRVVELFESRKPKNSAIISEIGGSIHFTEEKRQTVIVVTGEEGEKRYNIPYGFKIKVTEGQVINLGDPLTEGAVNPHDILAVKGEKAVQDYLISEVQKTYRLQGVDTNDKHIEVIVRQMMKKVRIKDPGSTELLTGSIMERGDVYRENQRLQARIDAGEAVSLITYEPVLLGITKAALATESFLSAASFQETTKVLTDAAIKGKTDHLMGLKENVIIGKLIPAGTGMRCYNEVEVVPTKAEGEETPVQPATPAD